MFSIKSQLTNTVSFTLPLLVLLRAIIIKDSMGTFPLASGKREPGFPLQSFAVGRHACLVQKYFRFNPLCIWGTPKNLLFFSVPLQFLPLRGTKHAFFIGIQLKTEVFSCILYIILNCIMLFAVALLVNFMSILCGTNNLSTALIEKPQTVTDYAIVIFSCLTTAYLEEGFFRFYFFEKLRNNKFGVISAVAISAICFAMLHVWEGVWGVYNALLAAFTLSFFYIQNKNTAQRLHIIAISHFIYNLIAFILM
jgi:membrane protease YdiL (CAAX protease family)